MKTLYKKQVNKVNLIVSVIVFGIGLILLLRFPIGLGAFRKEWLEVTKSTWLLVHQAAAVVFLTGLLVHFLRRRKRVFARNTARIHSIESIPIEKEARMGKTRSRRRRGHFSKYIYADTSKCKACWECIEACKYGVLGKVDFWFHKHVTFKNGDECRGCKKCIAACPNGVFQALTGVKQKKRTESEISG